MYCKYAEVFVYCMCTEEDLSEDEVVECANAFAKEFGTLNTNDLRKLRKSQRSLFVDTDLELSTCTVQQLEGAGVSRHFGYRIKKNIENLHVQEDLIQAVGNICLFMFCMSCHVMSCHVMSCHTKYTQLMVALA